MVFIGPYDGRKVQTHWVQPDPVDILFVGLIKIGPIGYQALMDTQNLFFLL